MIYDSNNNEIRLLNKIGHGGEGEIHLIQRQGYVAKIYNICNNDQLDYKKRKIEFMVRNNPNIDNCAWPITALYKDGAFIGYVMRQVEGKSLKKYFSPRNNNSSDKKTIVSLILSLLRTIKILHGKNILITDIKLENFFVENNEVVCFLDCDSYQIGEFIGRVVSNGFIAPEIYSILEQRKLPSTRREPESEYFQIFVLLFMMLHGGQAGPYNNQRDSIGKSEKEIVISGLFPYSVTSQQETKKNANPLLAIYWSHLPSYIKDAFYQMGSINGKHFNPKDRLKPDDWIALFEKYQSDLNDGTLERLDLDYNKARFKPKDRPIDYARLKLSTESKDEVYKKAIDFYYEKDYEQAKRLFDQLNAFQESKQFVNKCNRFLRDDEENKESFDTLLRSGKYDGVEILIGFIHSPKLKVELKNTYTKECIGTLLKKGSIQEAKDKISDLSNERDKETCRKDILQYEINSDINAKHYEDAIAKVSNDSFFEWTFNILLEKGKNYLANLHISDAKTIFNLLYGWTIREGKQECIDKVSKSLNNLKDAQARIDRLNEEKRRLENCRDLIKNNQLDDANLQLFDISQSRSFSEETRTQASELIAKCNEKIRAFENAERLFNEKDYYQAKKIYETLGSYKGSDLKSIRCETEFNTRFREISKAINSGEYKRAVDLSSGSLLSATYSNLYDKGNSLYENKEIEDAEDVFSIMAQSSADNNIYVQKSKIFLKNIEYQKFIENCRREFNDGSYNRINIDQLLLITRESNVFDETKEEADKVIKMMKEIEESYKSVDALCLKRNYGEACRKLKLLGDYKDSKELYKNYLKKLIEGFKFKYYLQVSTEFLDLDIEAADSEFADGNWYIAKDIYDFLSQHGSACSEKINECKNKIYEDALHDFNCYNFDLAMNKFKILDGYKYSERYVRQCQKNIENYEEGKKDIKNENYLSAISHFNGLGSYKASGRLLTSCQKKVKIQNEYNLGFVCFDQKKYEEAILHFQKTGNYKDSVQKIGECNKKIDEEKSLFDSACDLYGTNKGENIVKARDKFKKLKFYKLEEASHYIDLCNDKLAELDLLLKIDSKGPSENLSEFTKIRILLFERDDRIESLFEKARKNNDISLLMKIIEMQPVLLNSDRLNLIMERCSEIILADENAREYREESARRESSRLIQEKNKKAIKISKIIIAIILIVGVVCLFIFATNIALFILIFILVFVIILWCVNKSI